MLPRPIHTGLCANYCMKNQDEDVTMENRAGLGTAASTARPAVGQTAEFRQMLLSHDPEQDEAHLEARRLKNRAQKQAKKDRKRKALEMGEANVKFVNWDQIHNPEQCIDVRKFFGSDEHIRQQSRWRTYMRNQQLRARGLPEITDPFALDPDSAKRKAYGDNWRGDARPDSSSSAQSFGHSGAEYDSMDVDTTFQPASGHVAPATLYDDATGDDAYARRMKLSQQPPAATAGSYYNTLSSASQQPFDTINKQYEAQTGFVQPHQPQDAAAASQKQIQNPASLSVSFTPRAHTQSSDTQSSEPGPAVAVNSVEPAPATSIPANTLDSNPRHLVPSPLPSQQLASKPAPPHTAGIISRAAKIDLSQLASFNAKRDTPGEDTAMAEAPVEPAVAKEEPKPEPKLSFGERLLAKHGYKAGQGLGARGTGIATPLEAARLKAPKFADRFDADGQPMRVNAGIGSKGVQTITGGSQSAAAAQEALELTQKFGEQSRVVRLGGLLEGYDSAAERESGELLNRVGSLMGQRFGTVESIKMNWDRGHAFVQFVSVNSAIMARQGFHDGRFEGRVVETRFWDETAYAAGRLE